MKLKENITSEDYSIENGDFWYDLTLGGYCKPEELLESPNDAAKVQAAIEIIKEFEELLIELEEG